MFRKYIYFGIIFVKLKKSCLKGSEYGLYLMFFVNFFWLFKL